ncbi:MAG: EAL domain-containing protein, partial [Acidimicrobiales bacterium]
MSTHMDPRRHAPQIPAQLQLAYQPIVCLSLGLTHGARAVALHHPSTGPAPMAQVLALVAAGMGQAGPPANVALDLPRQALDGALPGLVERTLQRFGVLPTSISFALSANDAMADLRTTSSSVAALRSLGCEVGLSGVGATFASVRLLHIVPIDFAELAPSAVDGL